MRSIHRPAPPTNVVASKMRPNLFLSACTLYAVLAALAAGQGVQFNCPALPPLTQPAKTVYELRPQDIKVVMALGDSITAGESYHVYQRLRLLDGWYTTG